LASNASARAPEALKLNDDIIAQLRASDASAPERETLASAYYNRAWASRALGDTASAIEALSNALEIAPIEFHPAIILYRVNVEDGRVQRQKYTREAIKSITENRLAIPRGLVSSLAFSEHVLALTVSRAIQFADPGTIESLLIYIFGSLYPSRDEVDVLVTLFKTASTVDERVRFSNILRYATESYDMDSIPRSLNADVYRNIYAHSSSSEREIHGSKFLKSLSEHDSDFTILEDDISIVLSISARHFGEKNYRRSVDALSYLDKFADIIQERHKIAYIVWLQHQFIAYQGIGAEDSTRTIAEKILHSVNDRELENFDEDDKASLKQLREAAEIFLKRTNRDPYRKIGRNVRVKVRVLETGEIISAKFKNVEIALRAGRYELISAASD
jgi:tetratricopeptide (TPR) repeat protein